MLLMRLFLVFLGLFFALIARECYKAMYKALHVEAQPPRLDWDVFLLSFAFWCALLCATELLV